MIRILALALLLTASGCAGVPAAVIWVTVGSGLGATAAVVTLDDDALKIWNERNPPKP